MNEIVVQSLLQYIQLETGKRDHICHSDITAEAVSESDSTISCENDTAESKGRALEKTLLDLYSGCGAMSTGLCLGADNYGVKLVTVSSKLSPKSWFSNMVLHCI